MTIDHELKIIRIAKTIAVSGFLIVAILLGAIFYLEGFTIEFTLLGALVAATFVFSALFVLVSVPLICYYTVIEFIQRHSRKG